MNKFDIIGTLVPTYESIWTDKARDFISELAGQFTPRRNELLALRLKRQAEFDSGTMPDFLTDTIDIREGNWKTATIPGDLLDRRVEIISPVDSKSIINGLNAGANVFIADFEDSSVPLWDIMMQGQVNLRDAINNTLSYRSPQGNRYELLNAENSVIAMRPRGLHLPEKNVMQNDTPVPATLVDFGLYFFHNAKNLCSKGATPCFYLPKMEHYEEAIFWNDIFSFSQAELGIPHGTVRATVLIETLPAAFQMDEILFELREHAAGLLCGRWDYIFSLIKCLHNNSLFTLPERNKIKSTAHFLESLSQLLIKTCHRRGVHAIGNMVAQLPIKIDPIANKIAIKKVTESKEWEVANGYDGTWIGHPMLVPVVKKIFDAHLPGHNQINRKNSDVFIDRSDLFKLPAGKISLDGVKNNIDISLRYFDSWLRGRGCVRLYDLMEDVATAEISRIQLWCWIHHCDVALSDGRKITLELFHELLEDNIQEIRRQLGEQYKEHQYEKALLLLDRMTSLPQLSPFFTLAAYEFLELT